MQIKAVRIENFRSIRSLDCEFGAITTLIGPNGVGKSNVLRALDWFFNGSPMGLSVADKYAGAAEEDPIRVQVDFRELTAEDREALGPRYCPDSTTSQFTAWRTWHNGEERISGSAKAFKPFEEVRAHAKSGGRRPAYTAIREEHELPAWTSMEAAEAAMRAWEMQHPDRLTDAEVSDTNFFGATGRSKLASLFDFVFVSADLRVSDETSERKDSLLERIVRRAVDRAAFDSAVDSITAQYEATYRQLGAAHIGFQLDEIAAELTSEVLSYSPGRKIRLSQDPGVVRKPPTLFGVQVEHHGMERPATYQGHGFQRTLLLAGLTVLSRQVRSGGQATAMFLAIEEPELFQHPTQARAFALVLRNLAEDSAQRTQIAYATHSPYFISAQNFDEIRRISAVEVQGYVESRLNVATLDDVCGRLAGFVDGEKVRRRFSQVCLNYLPEALFAERVVLVEGDCDAAVLEGLCSQLHGPLAARICVAPVGGKGGFFIPFAILEKLGIETVAIVDSDSGCKARMQAKHKSESAVAEAETKIKRDNRALCSFAGAQEDDFPSGILNEIVAFVEDTLEELVCMDIPDWGVTKERLIKDGRGAEGKHANTYLLATRECVLEPGPTVRRLTEFCVG